MTLATIVKEKEGECEEIFLASFPPLPRTEFMCTVSNGCVFAAFTRVLTLPSLALSFTVFPSPFLGG